MTRVTSALQRSTSEAFLTKWTPEGEELDQDENHEKVKNVKKSENLKFEPFCLFGRVSLFLARLRTLQVRFQIDWANDRSEYILQIILPAFF